MDYYDLLLAKTLGGSGGGGGGGTDKSISTKSLIFYTNGTSIWDTNTQTLTISGTGTGTWPGVPLQNLIYKYSEVSSKVLRFKAKATMSGYSSGSGIILAPAVYSTENPVNNGANRMAAKTIKYITTNGTTDVDISANIGDLFTATGIDNYYFGFGILLNANSGTSVTMTDISVEIE